MKVRTKSSCQRTGVVARSRHARFRPDITDSTAGRSANPGRCSTEGMFMTDPIAGAGELSFFIETP
jgi:hypothetical protein